MRRRSQANPYHPAKEALLRLPSQPPVRTNVDAPSTPAPGMPCPTLAAFWAHTVATKESCQSSAVGVRPAVSPLTSSSGPESCLRPATTTGAPQHLLLVSPLPIARASA